MDQAWQAVNLLSPGNLSEPVEHCTCTGATKIVALLKKTIIVVME